MSAALIEAMATGLVASSAAGIFGVFSWLVSKLWAFYRHEIRDMKHATQAIGATLEKHLEHDEEIHRELTGVLGEVRGLLAAQAQQRAEA